MNNEVRYISVLPVVWEDKISDRIYAEISKEDGTYKLINVETIKGDELANLKQLSDK